MGAIAMTEYVIAGDACVAEGAIALMRMDADLARITPALCPLPLRLKPDGFAAVLQAIVGQQLSVASADAIWARLVAAGFDRQTAVQSAGDGELQAVGLSRPKVRYAKALAAAGIDYSALRDLPTDEVIATLVTVPGIGTWTAEIYAMFSLGRADVFAHGDLALQEAARMVLRLEARPTEAQMRDIAQRWSPWRAVAARILWAYYAQTKGRAGVT